MMAGPDNDQRSLGTTHIAKGALLFFDGQPGVRAWKVIDVTNRGAKIRTHDLALQPTIINLTFDNFRTIRRCRLIWRAGDLFGTAFED